jgi:AcrR family transcriptional regulator
MTPRTLSTAEARREEVLAAAERVYTAKGFHATPTMEVARAAGISQAYLFRLFPTKADLAIALVRRCNARIHGAFADAADRAQAAGDDVLQAMGAAYAELIGDRSLLLLQLHAWAAAVADPLIRDAMRESFGELVALVRERSGVDDEAVARFFASGMLLNVLGALDAQDAWAQGLRDVVTPDAAK